MLVYRISFPLKHKRRRSKANARKFAEEQFWSWGERMDAEIQAVEALIK